VGEGIRRHSWSGSVCQKSTVISRLSRLPSTLAQCHLGTPPNGRREFSCVAVRELGFAGVRPTIKTNNFNSASFLTPTRLARPSNRFRFVRGNFPSEPPTAQLCPGDSASVKVVRCFLTPFICTAVNYVPGFIVASNSAPCFSDAFTVVWYPPCSVKLIPNARSNVVSLTRVVCLALVPGSIHSA